MVLVRYTNMLWRTQSLVISVCLFSWTEVVLLLDPRSFPFFFFFCGRCSFDIR